MKTIQQIIKEMDPISIEREFFATYPIRLHQITNHDNLTIKEYKESLSIRFQNFLQSLSTMSIKENPEFQGILFVYKSQTDEGWLGESVGLINRFELNQDVSEISTYGYEFTEQSEALGFLVADTKLTQDNLLELVVSFLYEISFFGYEQEYLAEERAKLDQAVEEAKEMEKHPEHFKSYTMEDFRQMCGLPEEEIYPEEENKKLAFYQASWEYSRYCKEIELMRLKAAYEVVS